MLVIPGGPGENYGLRHYNYGNEPVQPYILRVGFVGGPLDFLNERLKNSFNVCLTKPSFTDFLKEIVNQNVLFKDFNYSGPFRNVFSSYKVTSPGFDQHAGKPIYRLLQLGSPEKKYLLVKANELDKESLSALLTNNTVFLECSKEYFPALYAELGGSEDRFINLFRV